MSAVLEARRLFARHPRAEMDSLRDVSLEVDSGEILALVGPNGSGKSTLLACLAGALRPRRGLVLLNGLDLCHTPARQRARHLARLPQEPVCPEGLSVEELVRLGRHSHRSFLSGLERPDLSAVREALRTMDLLELKDRPVLRLSGGERRRAWIALAIAQQAPLLLLDEPTASLDLRHQIESTGLLVDVNRSRGTTIVVALHDMQQAARIAHRVALIHRGRIYAVGRPEEVLTPEALRDVFAVKTRATFGQDVRIDVLGPADPVRGL